MNDLLQVHRTLRSLPCARKRSIRLPHYSPLSLDRRPRRQRLCLKPRRVPTHDRRSAGLLRAASRFACCRPVTVLCPMRRRRSAAGPRRAGTGASQSPDRARADGRTSRSPDADRTSVAMPSPDQLGVNIRQAAAACDWTAAHRRMQDLGVVSFQMDRLNADIFQVICLVPTRTGPHPSD